MAGPSPAKTKLERRPRSRGCRKLSPDSPAQAGRGDWQRGQSFTGSFAGISLMPRRPGALQPFVEGHELGGELLCEPQIGGS